LRLFSFGGYGLALAVLTLVVFGAYDSYPFVLTVQTLKYVKAISYNKSWKFEHQPRKPLRYLSCNRIAKKIWLEK